MSIIITADQKAHGNSLKARKESTEKNMAAVHFTTIQCEPNTANKHIESHIFGEIRPRTSNIVYARFAVFGTYLCVLMSVLEFFRTL